MKKKTPLLIVLVLLAVTVIGTTFAWFHSSDTVINPFKTQAGKIDITPDEEFENNESWNGDIKSKKVTVKNEDSYNIDVLIRVNLTPRWVEAGTDIPYAGDVSLIDLVFSNLDNNMNIGNDWVYGNDGYYYYKAKVAPGSSTEELLDSVKIKEEKTLPEEYEGKDFVVDVNAEGVAANTSEYRKVWSTISEGSPLDIMLSEICN